MELNNPKVFIIEPKTGLAHELPGVVKISMPHVDVGEFLPKPNPKTGLYSWQAKATCRTHISRKMRKDFRKVFYTPRPPKYIKKATYVQWIGRYDVTNFKSESELMRLSHRELEKIIAPLAPIIIMGETERASRAVPEHKTEFPCGGIVPDPRIEINVNTDQFGMTLEKCKQMAEELRQERATIQLGTIDAGIIQKTQLKQ